MCGHAAPASTVGDGWLGPQGAGHLDSAQIKAAVARMRDEARGAGRHPSEVRVVPRIIESAGESDAVTAELATLTRAGVDEIIVDSDWTGDGDAERVHDCLADAASEVAP